jgi:hypothetical protein
MAPFDDLRTDGRRLYVVDFGTDLGDPQPQDVSFHSRSLLRSYAERNLRANDPTQLELLYIEARKRLTSSSDYQEN